MGTKRRAAQLLSFVTMLCMLATLLSVMPQTASAANTTYYVDSAGGNDANNGTSAASPWKSITKVNSVTFEPGDKILFKAGGSWTGTLTPHGSGTADSPIVFDQYGTGAKPVIDGGGATEAVLIENIDYVTVQNLDITNTAAETGDRRGVFVRNNLLRKLEGITLKNLDIHHVKGDFHEHSRYFSAGILVWGYGANSLFNNLLIENNHIYDNESQGISFDADWPAKSASASLSTNVVVRGNVFERNASSDIVAGVSKAPLIEHNISYDNGHNYSGYRYIVPMWEWLCEDAVFQYNEVARAQHDPSTTNAEGDSQAFDADIATIGYTTFQYNYSHDNAGGFLLVMWDNPDLKGVIVRYNVSFNDHRINVNENKTIAINNTGREGSYVYNNVIYNNVAGEGIHVKDSGTGLGKVYYKNNIFYANAVSSYPENSARAVFDHNNYYGTGNFAALGDKNKMTEDPQFVGPIPNAPLEGIENAAVFKLRDTSPLIDAGVSMLNNGGKDFWGNTLYKGVPDIGAFESPNGEDDTTAPAQPTGLAVIDKTDTTMTLTWNATENDVPLDADIYDAEEDTKLASVMSSNTATITGLQPDTDYTFYIKAKDFAGNESPNSDPAAGTTAIASIIVDNAAATVAGTWTAATKGYSLNSDYVTIAKGSGANSVTWTPSLPLDGYYSVYYHLPNGASDWASNAPFTVNFDGGSKTYAVNEKNPGGVWVLLGIHKFQQGTTGNVVLTDNANNKVAADAVRFLYHEDFGPENITNIKLSSDRLQVKLEGTAALSVIGNDVAGKTLDMKAEGFDVQYESSAGTVAAVSEEGVVTGVAQGTALITATLTVNGVTVTSNSVEIIVGSAFIVNAPVVTDYYGETLAAFHPYEKVSISTKVINSKDRKQSVTLFAALYNENGLVKISQHNVLINSYDNATLAASLNMPADTTGCYLKVFVWDGKDAMHPLAAKTVVQND